MKTSTHTFALAGADMASIAGLLESLGRGTA
jgi:hypothetical protein